MTNRWLAMAGLFLHLRSPASAQPPIGAWREHLPFNNALAVALDAERVHCATPYGYFQFDRRDGSFLRRTKVNGLAEVRVSCMGKEPLGRRVLLAYANANIDILDGDRVLHIPDLMLSRVGGDKGVRSVLWRGNDALLSTGLGIVVIDAVRREVRDTYRPSRSGDAIGVNGLAFLDARYYAATAEGLSQASSAANLSDHRSWSLTMGEGLAPGAVRDVKVLGGAPVVLKSDSLLIRVAGAWRLLYADGWPVTGVEASGDRLYVCQSRNGRGRVLALDATGREMARFESPALAMPRQALPEGNACWVADQYNGLLRLESGRTERVFPNSPINTAAGDMLFNGGVLWAAAGAVNDAWNYTYNPNGLYRFEDGAWTGVNLYVNPRLDSLLDLVSLAAEPAGGRLWAGSFGGGLLEIPPSGDLRIHKQQTGLQEAVGDPGSYRVAGLAVDRDGDLWIANYGAPQNLVLRRKDGTWKRFTIPFLHTENAVSQVLLDEEGRKWIVSPKGNGLFVFDDRGTKDVTSDDRWRYLRQGKGSGGLPSSEVHCLARDRDGFVWIGTSRGVAVVQCVEDPLAAGCEAVLPVVRQGGFAGYLLSEEEVRAIAVDGANRKWIGTRNGVWLVSADGTEVITRFTEGDSPLLSDLVHRIAVDPSSGEVFISTFNGICSFRGTATEGVTDAPATVQVFPNPVPPGYAGSIAIRGLRRDAIVKIAEPDGRLVYQTRALGGQAVWDGRDYRGRPVASGAYLVLTADDTGRETGVAKVFIVR